MRRSSWTRLTLLLTLTLIAALTPLAVSAQDEGFPPFPVLVAGTVHVDGVLLTTPATLTARIGDWESRPVTVTDGRFGAVPGLPIIVGPPSGAYVGQEVTFHLNDELVALQRFIFELLGEPAARDMRLDFTRVAGPDQGVPSAAATPTPGISQENDVGEAPVGPPSGEDGGGGGSASVVLVVVLAVAAMGGAVVLVRVGRRR